MDPNQYLFDALISMTGGLISDMKTLYLGAIVLAFILMGLDHIKGVFDHMLEARSYKNSMSDAETMRMERDQYRRGSREWDEANYMYRHFIGKAANSRLKRWK